MTYSSHQSVNNYWPIFVELSFLLDPENKSTCAEIIWAIKYYEVWKWKELLQNHWSPPCMQCEKIVLKPHANRYFLRALDHPYLQNKSSTNRNIYHTVTHMLWKSFSGSYSGEGWQPIANILRIVAEKVTKSRFFSWNNLNICGDILKYIIV